MLPPTPPTAAQPVAVEATPFMDSLILGNSVRAWMVALATAVVIQAAFWIVRRLLHARFRRLSEASSSSVHGLVVRMLLDIRYWCVLAASVFVASQGLALPEWARLGFKALAVVAVALQLLLLSRLIVEYSIQRVMEKTRHPDGRPDPSIASATTIIRFISTIVIGSLLVLLALANLGVEITPLITGLGIGGIAVALAAQSILGDLFASLSILFDKPFLVGDFITVGEHMGTVEKIGVKSTLVRSLSGEQIVFRNTDLLGSRVRNYGRLQERRIVFSIGVTYETPADKLRMIPGIIREAIASAGRTRFDRCHFKQFGAYSLDFEAVYFVTIADYSVYMDQQQAINLFILERFGEAGINFAYPTQVEIYRTDPPPRLPA
jgi:small-conductance mechanosensitive channel